MTSPMQNLCRILAVLSLGACGGGGGEASGNTDPGEVSTGTYVALSDNNSASADSPLVVLSADTGATNVRRQSATLDRSDGANGSITGSVIAGALNAGRTQVAVRASLGGGVAILTNPDNSTYARVFTSPSGPGVFGEATEASDQPTLKTSITYRGDAIVDVNDGENIYELTGNSRVEADFATNRADVILSGLSGTANDGVNERNSNNVLTINIDDATISGSNGLSNGSVSFSASSGTAVPLAVTGFSGSQSIDHEGQFFGPLADEVGGVLVVDDPDAGAGLAITGVYIGDATDRREP